MRELQPTIRDCSLPREPFLRLIEANRMDQRVSEYETWADLKHYCVHSADPVGGSCSACSGAATTEHRRALGRRLHGLQLVNFLQDVPRDLALGRVYLPAEDRPRSASTSSTGRAGAARRCSSSRPSGPGLLVGGEELGGGSAAARRAGGRRSSRAAASRRSRRSSAPTGTSSTAGRALARAAGAGGRSGDGAEAHTPRSSG
jgi:hypothetical protein